jgi:hypothetical protein
MEDMHYLDFYSSAHNVPWETLYFGGQSSSTVELPAQEEKNNTSINVMYGSPGNERGEHYTYGIAVTQSPKSPAEETDDDSGFALDASPAGQRGGVYRHISLQEIGARPRVVSQEAQSESTTADDAAAAHASADSRDIAHKLSFYRTDSFNSFVA